MVGRLRLLAFSPDIIGPEHPVETTPTFRYNENCPEPIPAIMTV